MITLAVIQKLEIVKFVLDLKETTVLVSDVTWLIFDVYKNENKISPIFKVHLGCPHYQIVVDSKCQTCQNGKIPDPNRRTCVCPNGQVINPEQTDCKCQNGQAFVDNQCQICQNGTMPNSDQTACVCQNGKITNTEQTICACPIGQAFIDNQCQICQNETIPNSDQTACICPEGKTFFENEAWTWDQGKFRYPATLSKLILMIHTQNGSCKGCQKWKCYTNNMHKGFNPSCDKNICHAKSGS